MRTNLGQKGFQHVTLYFLMDSSKKKSESCHWLTLLESNIAQIATLSYIGDHGTFYHGAHSVSWVF